METEYSSVVKVRPLYSPNLVKLRLAFGIVPIESGLMDYSVDEV